MEFSFINEVDGSMVKKFLQRHGVSKRLLAKVKYEGGQILVNGVEQNAIYRLKAGDQVSIVTPDEPDNPDLTPGTAPVDVVFEDDHYLVVAKPAGVPSITGVYHPTDAMSNRVKGYIKRQNYANQTVHIITRLDRDTSGLMFFAKHRYAHALMVQSHYRDSLEKRYYAVVKNDGQLADHGEIDLPIGRAEGSIVQRRVRLDGLMEAKSARTSYRIAEESEDFYLLDVRLHTGRTHQIRVHFSHLGYPLLGDDLYGGSKEEFSRQALHCHHLSFINPFTEEKVELELGMPEDMRGLLEAKIQPK
ncbi:RluA family pseudouridine synthase [Lactococcus termiticola]|uniref:Pseudouridine synthase n=1 Tax=Lactococcus termiticola TaxID=2169526 RepID=A0A2R5HDA1_9LACT|nr:RluA family pseudouridine synthase [Lactococcus termiticola]GBG96054.1 ribosomal large subunit pseudouridine synthase D [Lactococcus termiticola]